MKNGKICQQYPERIRCFALTLHYYSPKAYNYVRETFKNTLPAISTIRSWYASIDGSPGISPEAMEAIKSLVKDGVEKGEPLLACLIFDEMAIRKHLQWDDSAKEIVGYVDKEKQIGDKNVLPVAREALVYMISFFGKKLSIPVAYFLTAGLKADAKAALTSEVLNALNKTGIKITSMTFDGHKSNFGMCAELGADFDNDMPYITNPHSSDNIYIFLDPCHVEKNARNCIARKKILYDDSNDKIQWRYFEELVKLQQNESIDLGIRINKCHIDYTRNIMSVRKACETLSNSVADAMELALQCGLDQFKGSEATVRYIRYMNNLFDIMNSRNDDKATYFKRPLSRETSSEYFAYFDEATAYIQQLKLKKNGKSILGTQSKTAYFGFVQNMKNLKNLYHAYIDSDILPRIEVFDISQDKLEVLFGRVRKMHGCNDNPTSIQFLGAMRRLYIHNDVTASHLANCADEDINILTVSSRRPKLNDNPSVFLSSEEAQATHVDSPHEDCSEELCIEEESELETDEEDRQPTSKSELHCHAIAYAASLVEQKIVKSESKKLLKCDNCLKVFSENDKIENSFISQKSKSQNISQPCQSTFLITEIADEIFKSHEYKRENYKNLLTEIIAKINLDTLFESSDFQNHCGLNHKYSLVKTIVDTFITMKSRQIASQKTLDCHKKHYRQKWHKIILNSGQ